MFRISQLRQIIRLSETGSYRQTAEQLGITHSALSYTVKKLEEKYGAAIFTRRGNRTQATPFGKILIDSARIAVESLEGAERGIASMLKMEAGRLVVGADSMASSGPVARAIIAMFKENADFKFTVLNPSLETMEQMLRDGLIDVYCGISPITKAEDLDFQSVFVQAPWLVCRQAHPLSDELARGPGAMDQYKIVSGDVSYWGQTQDQLSDQTEVGSNKEDPSLYLKSQDPYLAKSVVLQSDAIGLLPAHIAREEVASGRMVRLDAPASPVSKRVEFVVARRSTDLVTPIEMMFSREVRKAAIELSA